MYCSIDDLISRISEKTLVNLTNDILPAASINTEIAEENIIIADDLINSSLRNKYKLPLKATPKLIQQISADITIYRLYCRRPQNVPDNYKKNYEIALQILKDLQSGAKVLDLPSSSDGKESEMLLSSALYMTDKTEDDRHFSKSVMSGFTI